MAGAATDGIDVRDADLERAIALLRRAGDGRKEGLCFALRDAGSSRVAAALSRVDDLLSAILAVLTDLARGIEHRLRAVVREFTQLDRALAAAS